MGKSTTKTSSLLASFATLKSLSDANKYQSPYQILAEFVKYIIATESLYTFSAVTMKNYLHDYFDFEIPEAVVKTTSKKITGITVENGMYTIAPATVEVDSLFEEKQREADEYSSEIIESLAKYIQERTEDMSISIDYLTQSLVGFLVDDHSLNSTKYTDLISEFILKNENNEAVQNGLNRIREGSILYIGLNYNIGETGSIKKPLTLYLGTEILFSLVGYNGEISKELVEDFWGQVKLANWGKQKTINLRYFEDTKKEIDDFFFVAQDVADGKTALPIGKPAMAAITNGCVTSADVAIKKADFYHTLQHIYGITEDSKTDYYEEAHFTSNLESLDYDDDKKKKREIGIKQISHINKLRDGKHFLNDIDSGYLIVTNTRATLMISKEQVELIKAKEGLDFVSNFAVSLDRITSLLWYKLGGGFGQKSYPRNVSAVLKARVVLSSSIAKKAEKSFAEIKMQYEEGAISEDQLAARIITLRDKPNLPEEVQGDDIAEAMDFSPEFLSKYEERVKQDRNSLEEKEKLIETLQVENAQKLSDLDATIKGKEDENATLRAQLDEYHRKENQAKQRKLLKKNIVLFILSIAWKAGIVAAITAVIMWYEKCFGTELPKLIFAIIDAVGIIVVVWSTINAAKKKYFPHKKDKEQS